MYCIEANIGAGKTTFLKLIQERLPEVAVIFEPLHKWQTKVSGQSILGNFYQDPNRWAYTLETLTMACRVREHLKEQDNPNPFRIMERSIYSGHYVFALNGYHSGFLSELEWQIYLQWFNFLVKDRARQPQGIIYLKTDPQVAYERILKRDREAEKTISLEYITQIHEHHENFLVKKKEFLTDLQSVPVLVLDCNEEFEREAQKFESHAAELSAFMQLCHSKSQNAQSVVLS